MKRSSFGLYACGLVLVAGCGSPQQGTVVEEKATSSAAPSGSEGGNVVDVPGYPQRPFVRVNLDKLTWRAAENNTLGVQTAILEGDPSKPGFYLTINRFPPGVMSRPHYHPDERNCIVLKGTWYTGEGEKWILRARSLSRSITAASTGATILRRAGRGSARRHLRLRPDVARGLTTDRSLD